MSQDIGNCGDLFIAPKKLDTGRIKNGDLYGTGTQFMLASVNHA